MSDYRDLLTPETRARLLAFEAGQPMPTGRAERKTGTGPCPTCNTRPKHGKSGYCRECLREYNHRHKQAKRKKAGNFQCDSSV